MRVKNCLETVGRQFLPRDINLSRRALWVNLGGAVKRHHWETSKGRQQQLLASSLGALDATSKAPFPLWQTEARQHELNKDVAADVCSSCNCCPYAGFEPQRNCVTKILPNVQVNFAVRFALKPLFYSVMTGNTLELFRKMLGTNSCNFSLYGSFLAPDFLRPKFRGPTEPWPSFPCF